MTVAIGYNKVFTFGGTKLPAQRMFRRAQNELIDDTNIVYSGGFSTNVPGIQDQSFGCSGHVGRKAGYLTTLKSDGTPVGVTDEATTLVSGKIYRITDATRRIIDESVTGESTLDYITVKDGGTALDPEDIESIDHLTGTIELAAAYSVGGAITADYDYIPTSNIAQWKDFDLTLTGAVLDVTDNPAAAANGGLTVNDIGLISAALRFGRNDEVGYSIYDLLAGRTRTLVDLAIGPDLLTMRGWFYFGGDDGDGDVSGFETEAVTGTLAGASETNFSYLAGSTLNAGLTSLLSSFLARSAGALTYLPDGTNGWSGNCKVSELGFRGTTRGVDEFSCALVPSGAISKTP